MKKAAVSLFVGLALVASSPAFAQAHYESQGAPAFNTWKAPYDLPAGPSDIPFAPF